MTQKINKAGIVCCSNGQEQIKKEQVEKLLQVLTDLGITPVCSDYIYEKDGNINDNIFEVENIKVDLLNHILYREDASYKYTLDYKQNNANIELKEHNYSLNLLLETKSILKNDEYLRIIYSIESEDKIDNILEIYF